MKAKGAYKVLTVIRDQWFSDHKRFQSFNAARRYQASITSKFDTAILAPDGRVLNYRDVEMEGIR